MLLLFFIFSHSLQCIWLFGFPGVRIKFTLNHMNFWNTFKMSCQLQINDSYWFHTRDPCSNPSWFFGLFSQFFIWTVVQCLFSYFSKPKWTSGVELVLDAMIFPKFKMLICNSRTGAWIHLNYSKHRGCLQVVLQTWYLFIYTKHLLCTKHCGVVESLDILDSEQNSILWDHVHFSFKHGRDDLNYGSGTQLCDLGWISSLCAAVLTFILGPTPTRGLEKTGCDKLSGAGSCFMSYGLSLFTCQVLSSRVSQASGQPRIFPPQESCHELLLIGNIRHGEGRGGG